jgi:hypothetical protein
MKSSNRRSIKYASFFIFILLSLGVANFAQKPPVISETDRTRLAEVFHLENKISDQVWKDWHKTPLAILLVTPEDEFLIGHPSPSKDFTEIGYDRLLKNKVYWRKRVFNPAFLATFPAVQGSGVSTIVVGQAENTWVKTSTLWVVTLLHEHFHQLQDSQPDVFQEIAALDLSGGDETGMWQLNYPFPYADKKINEDFSALAKQLAKTLETRDKPAFQNELKAYLKMRKDFNNLLKPNDYKYISFQFWKEGTARYTEIQIAKLAAKNYKPTKNFTKLKDYKTYSEIAVEIESRTINSLKNMNLKETQREVVYAFGAGEALLLDKAGIDWKPRYFSQKFYLDKYFDLQK